jgi:hypothetical protein
MRRLFSISVSICMCFAAFALTGCEKVECDPCPANGDVTVCNAFEGVYFGTMVGQGGTCTDEEEVLTGDLRVTARKIVSGGDEDPTEIEIELEDEDGNWTIFTGNICNTEDTESPKAYPFSVTYSVFEQDEGLKLNNVLSGFFLEADLDEDLPVRIDATYTVALSITDAPDKGCNMSAHLTAEP